jgi:hypothetical protein
VLGLEGNATRKLPAVARLREGLKEQARLTATVRAHGKADIVLAMPAAGPLPEEGYRLTVTKAGVRIEGGDARGLFWGVVSLLELISAEDGRAAVKQATILDWPRHPFRGVHVYIPAREDIPFFKRYIRYFLADHKMNTIFLEVGAGMELKKHPEVNEGAVTFARDILGRGDRPKGPEDRFQNSTHHELAGGSFLTQDEVRDLVDYARAHEVEVIPEIQGLTHVYHLLAGHRELAELPETEWPDAYCPSNPATYDLLFDVMEEYVDVIRPTRVHIGHDEWRAGGLCPKCKGHTAQLFAEDVAKMHRWLTDRGIGVMMWGDHYVKEHDGNARSTRSEGIWYDYPQTYEAIEVAPKDIILLNWSYSMGEQIEDELTRQGFRQIYGNFSPERFSPEEWNRRSAKPHILGGEVSSWTAANEFCLGKDGILHSMLFAANSLWAFHHLEPREQALLLRDLFIPLRERLGGTPSPALHVPGDAFVAIDLKSSANRALPGGGCPPGARPAGGRGLRRGAKGDPFPVPFKVTGRCLQLRREGEPTVRDEGARRRARAVARADAALPGADEEAARKDWEAPPSDAPTTIEGIRVEGKFRSLVFLQACAGTGRHGRTFSTIGRVADSSERIGFYRIHYQDGRAVEVDIRYGQNVARPDGRAGSGRDAVCYFAVPVFAGEGKSARTFSAFEWVNPRPKVALQSVDFVATKAETAAAPILLAITGVT